MAKRPARRCPSSRGLREHRVELAPRLGALALEVEAGGDAEARVDEVGAHPERLAVVGDRLVEAAELEQQLGVRVVGVGVVGQDLGVLLERGLGPVHLAEEAVAVAELVVDLGEARGDRRGALVERDRLDVALGAEVGIAEQHQGALVVRVLAHELVEELDLLGVVAAPAGLGTAGSSAARLRWRARRARPPCRAWRRTRPRSVACWRDRASRARTAGRRRPPSRSGRAPPGRAAARPDRAPRDRRRAPRARPC